MAVTFEFLGCTNHEMVYDVHSAGTEAPETGDLLASGIVTEGLILDAMPRTPLHDFVSQQGVHSASRARTLIFGYGLDGEITAKQLLLGEAYIQGYDGVLAWDLDADTDGSPDGLLKLTVTAEASGSGGSAYLRIRVKHTIDR